MARSKSVPLIQVAVENVGVMKAGQALGNLVTWCWSMNRHPEAAGTIQDAVEAYAADWLCSVATAYRHRKLVVEAFDGVDLDQVAALVEEYGQGRRTQRGALKVAAEVAPLLVHVEAA